MLRPEFHMAAIIGFLEANESGLTSDQIREKTGWGGEVENAIKWLLSEGYICKIHSPDRYGLTPDMANI